MGVGGRQQNAKVSIERRTAKKKNERKSGKESMGISKKVVGKKGGELARRY